jgi:hypothetical protein
MPAVPDNKTTSTCTCFNIGTTGLQHDYCTLIMVFTWMLHRATENIMDQVLARKRKRALLIKAGANVDNRTSRTALASMPVLSLFVRESLQHGNSKANSVRSSNAVTDRDTGNKGESSGVLLSGLLRSTGLLVEHSSTQRVLQIFLRVLTVLFLTVALHHVKADVAIGEILLATNHDHALHGIEDDSRLGELKVSLLFTPQPLTIHQDTPLKRRILACTLCAGGTDRSV